jgi:protein-tyrosine-phosphatase
MNKRKKNMSQTPLIVFVCEHGAAKSVVAAAYFNQLARAKNLPLHAIARGTHPDSELSPAAVAGLQQDGLTPTESVPQRLLMGDFESAQKIVSFCRLPDEFHQGVDIQQWNDVPPVSENYEEARDAIVKQLNQLLNQI